MSLGLFHVQLERDGQGTAWGFRLYGGLDVGCPLCVQRTFIGSPSEGELHRGDVILRIGDRDTSKLTHQQAHDIIKKAGNHLSLVIQRIQSGGCKSPASTTPVAGHPLANPTMYRSTNPTTHFADQYRPFVPEPQTQAAAESLEFYEETSREKQAITHQAYRTLPLIAPKAKTIHDYPTGSYLKHVKDPNWKTQSHQGTPMNLAALHKIQQASAMTNVQVITSNSPVHTPESTQTVHLQYNSPINMYSTQSVADTLSAHSAHTGLQPRSSYSPQPKKPSYLSQPSRPTPLSCKVVDITKSPTYKVIHDHDEVKEHRPVDYRVYDVPAGPENPYVNALGVPRGKILQSGSFNTIMSTLTLGSSQL